MRGSNFGLDWENNIIVVTFWRSSVMTGCLHAEACQYIEILFL